MAEDPTALSPRELPARLKARLRGRGGRSGSEPRIERLGAGDRIPLSFGQQQIWFLSRLAGGREYAITMGIPLAGPLDVDALRRSLETVIARHDILRTIFVADGADVVQVVREAAAVTLPVEDLSA